MMFLELLRSNDSQFCVRTFDHNERLVGHKNFKAWKAMIEIELKALDLHRFIQSPDGDPNDSGTFSRIRFPDNILFPTRNLPEIFSPESFFPTPGIPTPFSRITFSRQEMFADWKYFPTQKF